MPAAVQPGFFGAFLDGYDQALQRDREGQRLLRELRSADQQLQFNRANNPLRLQSSAQALQVQQEQLRGERLANDFLADTFGTRVQGTGAATTRTQLGNVAAQQGIDFNNLTLSDRLSQQSANTVRAQLGNVAAQQDIDLNSATFNSNVRSALAGATGSELRNRTELQGIDLRNATFGAKVRQSLASTVGTELRNRALQQGINLDDATFDGRVAAVDLANRATIASTLATRLRNEEGASTLLSSINATNAANELRRDNAFEETRSGLPALRASAEAIGLAEDPVVKFNGQTGVAAVASSLRRNSFNMRNLEIENLVKSVRDGATFQGFSPAQSLEILRLSGLEDVSLEISPFDRIRQRFGRAPEVRSVTDPQGFINSFVTPGLQTSRFGPQPPAVTATDNPFALSNLQGAR